MKLTDLIDRFLAATTSGFMPGVVRPGSLCNKARSKHRNQSPPSNKYFVTSTLQFA